jgi:hypothetical protein
MASRAKRIVVAPFSERKNMELLELKCKFDRQRVIDRKEIPSLYASKPSKEPSTLKSSEFKSLAFNLLRQINFSTSFLMIGYILEMLCRRKLFLDSVTDDSVLPAESRGSKSSEGSLQQLPEATGYSQEASDNYHLFIRTSEFDIEKLLNSELQEFNSNTDVKEIQTKEEDTLVRESHAKYVIK